jgi:hypothetical protein
MQLRLIGHPLLYTKQSGTCDRLVHTMTGCALIGKQRFTSGHVLRIGGKKGTQQQKNRKNKWDAFYDLSMMVNHIHKQLIYMWKNLRNRGQK